MQRVKPWLGLSLAAVSGVLYSAITVASKAAHAHPLAKGMVSALAAAGIALLWEKGDNTQDKPPRKARPKRS